MAQNIVAKAFKSLLIDMLEEILYFPIWWYTRGLKRSLFRFIDSLKNSNRDLALGIMFKNLFKPMFGAYDRSGRAISFFMRLILTFSRLIIFVFMFIFHLAVLFFWLAMPIIVFFGLWLNFKALWSK